MNGALLFVLGVGVGLVAARALMTPSDCCVRVAAGVRERVQDELGGTAVAIGDAIGLWPYTPGLLTALGVAP